jgi:predicted esterase
MAHRQRFSFLTCLIHLERKSIPMSPRTWLTLTLPIFLLAAPVGAAAATQQASGTAPETKTITYRFEPGDVLVYSRVFETENHPVRAEKAKYGVRSEWLVKVAVLGKSGRIAELAVQTNLRKLEIQRREGLESALGKADAADILSPYENFDTALVRHLFVDDAGNVRNDEYDLNMAVSSVCSFMTGIARLPERPIRAGESYPVADEESIDVTYAGETNDERGTFDLFTAVHPSGRAELSIDAGLGVPNRLEYTSTYLAADQVRREAYSLILKSKETSEWADLLDDPDLNKALVLASLSRRDLACDAKLIRSLLSSPDIGRQNVAAAYCGQRGIPDGMDSAELLSAINPVVRFNAAKALFRSRGEAGPLRAMIRDSDPYLRRRALSFLEHAGDMVPTRLRPLTAALQGWLFDGGSLPEVGDADLNDLREALAFVKPENDLVAGCYKKILVNAADRQRPYYLRLPKDYDPAEVYPLFIYLGMGDGRGDIALKAITDAMKTTHRLADFILLVPQAHGKWWDKDVETAVNGVLRTVLRSVSVDTNAIVLAGSSNGGMGTIYFGTHLPDRFIALASNMGFPAVERDFPDKPAEFEPLKNLYNARVFLSHGRDDAWVPPEADRGAAAFLRRNRIPVMYDEIPRKGHDVPITDVLAKALEFFGPKERNPSPSRIEFVMNEPEYPTCYWVTVLATGGLPAKVTARIEGNTVDIKTEKVWDLRLSLDETLVDPTRPVSIRINDREVFRGMLHPSASTVLASAKERGDAQMAYSVSLDLKVISVR